MTLVNKEQTVWCEFLQQDNVCTLMQGLDTEISSICKLHREQPADCRYLRLHVLKERRR